MLTAVCVDDSLVELACIERIVREMGIDVIARAQTGDSGLAAIRARRPDVAILDIILPGLTGVEILKSVMAENLATTVVMASSMSMLKKQAADAGARHFVVKPYDEIITKDELRPIFAALG